MDKIETKNGIIYILSNPSFPNYVKIGKTSKNVKHRMDSLYNTSVPTPFKCEYACEVENYEDVEKKIHYAFSDLRVNENREFFEIDADKIKAILEIFCKKNVTASIDEEVNEKTDSIDKASSEKLIKRKPSIDFFEIGLKVGDILTYTKDPKITVSIYDNKHVKYIDDIYTLSPLTMKLMKREQSIRGTDYWEFNGKPLIDLYKEKYV